MAKKKTRRGGGRRKKLVAKKLKNVPKPIAEKAEKMAEKPEDIRIENPAPDDPVVTVKGKTVWAWIDI